ncbi:hypothetical protein PYW07_002972 [Mythimna separata]|uniref:RIIa domain-containing protein n=1 Tax=Mythimna separata TaxID=271217 RepID=A0AAD7YGW6_MYTSE|nr:hypothetical protein PYW07_002972 [Mythimna separata]
MEDLIPPQIKDNCKLALPDGLKELMSDITREVLRYQPRDLYKFIADYLSAMLVTRDNLSIAGYLCSDITSCTCEPELFTELRDIGVPESEAEPARDIIVKYLEKGAVNEGNLLTILLKDTNIPEDILPAVQDAIRNAYLRHMAHHTTKYESSSEEEDAMMRAAKHTLELYRKTEPNEKTYAIMAEKIQKSYRAYGVRRESILKSKQTNQEKEKPTSKPVDLNPPAQMPSPYDIVFPKMMYSKEGISIAESQQDPELGFHITSSVVHNRLTTASSTSLAGSYVTLPSFKPYSVHDDNLSNLEEFPEREHAHIDYTNEHPHFSMVTEPKLYKTDRRISFTEAEKNMVLGAHLESKVSNQTNGFMMGINSEDVQDDFESKASNQTNDFLVAVDSEGSYDKDGMRLDSDYDADSELDKSDVNLAGSLVSPEQEAEQERE